jgi:hypothetical protein
MAVDDVPSERAVVAAGLPPHKEQSLFYGRPPSKSTGADTSIIIWQVDYLM